MRLKTLLLRAGKQVLLHDVDDPLARVARQVDLLVAGEVLERALDVRLLEKAEGELDADDVALLRVAVEHGHLIAAAVDIGRLLVRDLDEDEVARQDAGALGDEPDERRARGRRAIARGAAT